MQRLIFKSATVTLWCNSLRFSRETQRLRKAQTQSASLPLRIQLARSRPPLSAFFGVDFPNFAVDLALVPLFSFDLPNRCGALGAGGRGRVGTMALAGLSSFVFEAPNRSTGLAVGATGRGVVVELLPDFRCFHMIATPAT